MVCSVCGCAGHNKRTCSAIKTLQLIKPEKKEVVKKEVVMPSITFKPSSIEVEIGLLQLVFQLPNEVIEIIKKEVFWGDWKPTLLPKDDIADECDTKINFGADKVRMELAMTQENGRRWSLENAAETITTGTLIEHIGIQGKAKREFGSGNNKHKKQAQLYYETLKGMTLPPNHKLNPIRMPRQHYQRTYRPASVYTAAEVAHPFYQYRVEVRDVVPYKRLNAGSWVN